MACHLHMCLSHPFFVASFQRPENGGKFKQLVPNRAQGRNIRPWLWAEGTIPFPSSSSLLILLPLLLFFLFLLLFLFSSLHYALAVVIYLYFISRRYMYVLGGCDDVKWCNDVHCLDLGKFNKKMNTYTLRI